MVNDNQYAAAGRPLAPTPEGEAAEATGLDAPALLREQRRPHAARP